MEDFILDDSLFEELIQKDKKIEKQNSLSDNSINSCTSLTQAETEDDHLSHSIIDSREHHNLNKEDTTGVEKEDTYDIENKKGVYALDVRNGDVEEINRLKKEETIEKFEKWLIEERRIQKVLCYDYASIIRAMDKVTEQKLGRSVILEDNEAMLDELNDTFQNQGTGFMRVSALKYFKRFKNYEELENRRRAKCLEERRQKINFSNSSGAIALLEFRNWLKKDGFLDRVIENYIAILQKYDKSIVMTKGKTLLTVDDYRKVEEIRAIIDRKMKMTTKEKIAFKYYIMFLKEK